MLALDRLPGSAIPNMHVNAGCFSVVTQNTALADAPQVLLALDTLPGIDELLKIVPKRTSQPWAKYLRCALVGWHDMIATTRSVSAPVGM